MSTPDPSTPDPSTAPEGPALPTPVAAAVGLVVTYLEGVRRLPLEAVRVPIRAIGFAMSVTERLISGYGELAERGETAVARLRSASRSVTEEATEDLRAAVGSAVDTAVDTGEAVAGAVRSVPARALQAVRDEEAPPLQEDGPAAIGSAVEDQLAQEAAEVSADVATLTTTAEPAAEPEAGTASTVSDVVDPFHLPNQDERAVEAATPGATLDSADLPLPDFDHMTLGSLRGRMRRLAVPELIQLRDYERVHAGRRPVLTLLENRIAKLALDDASGSASSPAETG